MSGLTFLYKLLLKETAKGSGKASGIMSIGPDIRKTTMNKYSKYVDSAKRQGVDLDKLSEQEIKYMLQLNKPKPIRAIPADSPEGKGITEMLLGKRGEVIKGDFGGGITDDVSETIIKIKTMEPMESMKEANKVLKGEGRYKRLSQVDREKIVNDEGVMDHIFERNVKPDPEDMADGGRTGLNYLLAEDTNERVPFKMGRRAFLKLMGAGAAGIGALKTGALKLFGKEGATVAKEITQVPIKTGADGMPAWFQPLVNRIIKEGEEVESGAERVIRHKAQLPKSKTDIIVEQDLTTGDVRVDIGMEKHGFADGKFGQPVRLEYKAKELIEPDMDDAGKIRKKGGEMPEEFNVEEAEFTGGHPENVKFEESSINKFGQHESDFREVEEFAIGKNTIKGQVGSKSSLQKQSEDLADHFSNYPEPDDFASGGRVPLSEGKDARYENYYIDPETGELKRKPKLKPKAEPHWKYDIDEEGNLVPKPKIKPQLMASGGLAKLLGE